MFLKSISLKNIRSYIDQTITFDEGSTLLAGDIGSGKSTILLAIEFALFGTSRPDLPAETLLRKGTTNAYVELSFNLQNQQITVRRNLKRDKNSIKQTAGHLIINDTKTELTAVELKAQILNLLAYPGQLVNKNKNYIFRYTIYTPQEDMKAILQDNPELRLEVLRKIFDIEKYQNIRDNLQIVLKELRKTIAQRMTRLENYSEQEKKMEQFLHQKIEVNRQLSAKQLSLRQLTEKIKTLQGNLEQIEAEQKITLSLKSRQENITQLQKQLQFQIEESYAQQQNLLLQMAAQEKFSEQEEINLNEILSKLEKEKENYLQKESSLNQKLAQIQQEIKQTKQNNESLQTIISTLQIKEEKITDLTTNITKKSELKIKSDELESLIKQTQEIITRNQVIIDEAKVILANISKIDTCPTCQQQVSVEHKEQVIDKQQEKIAQAQLTINNSKIREINEEKQLIQAQIEKIIQEEKELAGLTEQVTQLQQKRQELTKGEEQLLLLVQENNQLMQELQKLNTSDQLKKINDELNRLRERLLEFKQAKSRAERLKTLEDVLERYSQQVESLQSETKQINEKLQGREDLAETINLTKDQLTNLREQEKQELMLITSLTSQIKHLQNQIQEINLVLEKLNQQKTKLQQEQQLSHWLEKFFLPLAYSIERAMMLNIHQLFNQLFQEWFSLLISDEQMNARIDDSFSPVIEQNGYEINFSALSGGERTSAALAYRLALNKVINDVVHQIKTKELLILDEPTDGFSAEQLDKVRDVLERLNLQQTILVSHESKIESFVDNVITITKQGHESSVI
ncbi:hypothetical protein CL620_05380 [archaeon]|nr:hypothetical protein [archaeon]